MTAVFLKILNMSIAACWLILSVLVLRLVLRRAPRWTHLLLWAIVALRLAVPFSFESALSLTPSAQTIPPTIGAAEIPGIDTGFGAVNDVINPLLRQYMKPRNVYLPGEIRLRLYPMGEAVELLTVVWLAGMAVMLGYTVVSSLLLHHKLRDAVSLRENICRHEAVDSPFVFGVFRPKICLPFTLTAPDMDYVIAHEKAHLRRLDHLWKPLGFLLLSVHWFNPLVWLAYGLFCRDVELACDQRVIRTMDSVSRAAYTEALVACSLPHRRVSACPLSFGEAGVKERVRAVMLYKKPAVWAVIIALVLCAAAALCFLTDPLPPAYDQRTTVLAYIHEVDEDSVTFDVIEWVTDGSERALALGIPPASLPNGFYIHNEVEFMETLPFAEDCTFHVFLWPVEVVQHSSVNFEEFIEQREMFSVSLPYHVTIEKNRIIDITEQYIP